MEEEKQAGVRRKIGRNPALRTKLLSCPDVASVPCTRGKSRVEFREGSFEGHGGVASVEEREGNLVAGQVRLPGDEVALVKKLEALRGGLVDGNEVAVG
jgi:hypothetical protein